jgi:hypothetical protein
MPASVNSHPLIIEYLLKAIKIRLDTEDASGANTGLTGVYLADMPEKTIRPYLVIVPSSERPLSKTARTKFVECTFMIEIAANSFASLSMIMGLLNGYLENAPYDFTGAPSEMNLEAKKTISGDAEFTKDGEQWVGQKAYVSEVSASVVNSPT